MSLLSRIKETAKDRGITIEQLAKKASVSKSGLYQWDDHEPRPSSIKAVADVLNVSVDFLLGNTDEKNPNKKTESIIVDDLDPAKVEFVNKISKENLNEKQLEELDNFLEYLKVKYVKDMREIENDERKN